MKTSLYSCAVMLLILSITSFFGALTYEVFHVGYTLRADTDKITATTVAQIDGLNLKARSQHADDLIRGARALVDHADRTTTRELAYLDTWNESFTHTLSGVDNLVATANDSVKTITSSASETLSATTETIKAAKPVLNSATKTENDIDAFIKSPDLTATIANVQVTTKNVGEMTTTANAVETKATKPYLDPKPKTFWQKVKDGLETWIPIGAKAASAAL